MKIDEATPFSPSKTGSGDPQAPLPPPPAYDASSGSGTGDVLGITRPDWTRGNHIYINYPNDSLKGQWTIDPSLVIPSSLLPTLADGESLDNCHLVCMNGTIKADLSLVSEKPTKSHLFVESFNGSINIKVAYRANQTFRMTARSWNGSVKVAIPNDFRGPVTQIKGYGGIKFSDAILKRMTQFGTMWFIGEWDGSGYGEGNLDDWAGDELILEAKNGSTKVEFFVEEGVPTNSGSRGFFKWFSN